MGTSYKTHNKIDSVERIPAGQRVSERKAKENHPNILLGSISCKMYTFPPRLSTKKQTIITNTNIKIGNGICFIFSVCVSLWNVVYTSIPNNSK